MCEDTTSLSNPSEPALRRHRAVPELAPPLQGRTCLCFRLPLCVHFCTYHSCGFVCVCARALLCAWCTWCSIHWCFDTATDETQYTQAALICALFVAFMCAFVGRGAGGGGGGGGAHVDNRFVVCRLLSAFSNRVSCALVLVLTVPHVCVWGGAGHLRQPLCCSVRPLYARACVLGRRFFCFLYEVCVYTQSRKMVAQGMDCTWTTRER